MKHGSLFSGIGGFELAAQWMGWENLFHCEWNPFGQQILKHHFPESKSYTDVTKFCATAYAGRIDILTGGFPCQPYSLAGKRKGKDDERHLWPEMLRIVRECAPRYVVGENVRGLVGWNGGMVFEEVCADLEAEGYTVQPFLLPAAGVGAPHRRDRVWFVAHRENNGSPQATDARRKRRKSQPFNWDEVRPPLNTDGRGWDAPDSDDKGGTGGLRQVQGTHGEVSQRDDDAKPCNAGAADAANSDGAGERQDYRQREPRQFNQESAARDWQDFPTVAPICGGDDGLPKELDGISFPKWRRESIKAYGNAIVPQVALQIFKAIQMMEDEGW